MNMMHAQSQDAQKKKSPGKPGTLMAIQIAILMNLNISKVL
jgi:hypothetical protein